MAGYADQLTIKVSAEDAGVKASVNAMRSEIRGLEKELAKSNAEWMKTGKGSDEIKRAEQRIVALRTEVAKLTGTQKKATAQTRAHGNAFTRMGQQVNRALGGLSNPLLFAGAGIALAMFAKKTITAASDVTESLNKTKVIFGEASQAVIDYADTAADRFGQSKSQALGAAANFASLGKAAGLSGAELSDFALELSGLAADISSFNNMAPEEAIVALSAALRGEYEPLRRANILLDAASLSQAAFNQGLTDTVEKTLPQNIKVLAAYQEILSQSTDQQGDFNRTQDDYANLSRRVAAEWQNLQASIGESFMPAAKEALTVLKLLFGVFNEIPAPMRSTGIMIAAVGAALVLLAPKILAVKTLIRETGAAATVADGRFKGLRTGFAVAGSLLTPWTIALGVLTVAVIGYANAQAKAAEATERFKATLDPETFKPTMQTYTDTAKALQDVITPETLKLLALHGITLSDITKATVDGGEAATVLRGRMNELSAAYGFANGKTTGLGNALATVEIAMDGEREGLDNATKAMKAGIEASKEGAAAANSFAVAQDRLKQATDGVAAAQNGLLGTLDAVERKLDRNNAKRAYRAKLAAFEKDPSQTNYDEMIKASNTVARLYKDPKFQSKWVRASGKEMTAAITKADMPDTIKKQYQDPIDMVLAKLEELDAQLAIKRATEIWIKGGYVPMGPPLPTTPTMTPGYVPWTGGRPEDGKAQGGPVWGPGTGTSDSIPAMLSNGEFVVRAAAVRALGIDTLSSINRADKMVDPSLYTRLASRDAARVPVAQPVAVQAQSGPAIGSVVVNNPAQTVDVERAVLTALRRADRIKRERG
jgi:hypothetical protein